MSFLHSKAIALLLLLSFFPSLSETGLRAEAAESSKVSGTASSAAELANQLAAAYGGMAKIKEMLNRGCRSKGTLHNLSSISASSNSFDCIFLSKGNKLRIEMQLLGQEKVTAFDGKVGWSRTGDWVSREDDKTVARMSDEMKRGLNALDKLDDPTYKLQLLAPQTVNGKNCDVLKLQAPDGKATSFFIDPLSRLVQRSQYMALDTEQGVETLKTVDYFDYRNILGFPTPFKIVESLYDKKTQEADLEAVTVDDGISDELFRMPEESRYSRLENGPVTVPFEFSGNEIIIGARINGGNEAKFIVDTGASQTVIDKATAQNLAPTTVHTFSVTAGAKAVPLSYTKLDKIQIGELSIENVSTLVTDLSSFSAAIGQRPAGLIGANILKRFLLGIDFQNKKLILSDPRNVNVPDKAIVVATSPVFASTGLVVNGILDGKAMNFLVDTGAAFNNLPYSLASKLNMGAVLPVGQIHGLDGQKTSIGSIKLKDLKLGGFTIKNPVFAVQPERGNSAPAGLFSASSMGILGNPIWSMTTLNVDYRNDRLIIEIPDDKQSLEVFLSQIEEAERTYLRTRNIDNATASYEKIQNSARDKGVKAAEALALAKLSGLYADRYNIQKESRFLDMSGKEYERAAKIAQESRNKAIEGQILAQWAMLYLNAPRSNTDLISAQNLLKKALSRAPMDGSIFAALGTAMLKTGKSPLGSKFIDQALMLDPSNWQALWSKYKLLESEGNRAGMKLLLAQLNRYYPDFPQVKEANSKLAAAQAATKAPTQRNPKAKNASAKH
ncbi:MAG: aspartyl protease family protein [Candidatus Obscuribacterales bacterium]|nr:aspartyl protease family protein [Candidatus Obscuribacterales bacterium]